MAGPTPGGSGSVLECLSKAVPLVLCGSKEKKIAGRCKEWVCGSEGHGAFKKSAPVTEGADTHRALCWVIVTTGQSKCSVLCHTRHG